MRPPLCVSTALQGQQSAACPLPSWTLQGSIALKFMAGTFREKWLSQLGEPAAMKPSGCWDRVGEGGEHSGQWILGTIWRTQDGSFPASPCVRPTGVAFSACAFDGVLRCLRLGLPRHAFRKCYLVSSGSVIQTGQEVGWTGHSRAMHLISFWLEITI